MTQTTTSSLSTDIAAHEQLMRYALRPQLHFDPAADVRPTNQTSRGASVTFYITDDLAAATSALTETSDVTAVAMSDGVVTLTLSEYGNAVQTTGKLRGTSFIDVDPTMANVVGFNAGLSIDTLAVNAMAAGTNVLFGDGTTAGAVTGTPAANNRIGSTDTLNGSNVRYVNAKLHGANVMPRIGSLYAGWMHPDVAMDFKGSTGGTNWSDPHVYSTPENIYNGVVGAFQGVMWMETPRCPITADAGDGAGSTGTIDVYTSFVAGREALARAHSDHPEWGMFPRYVDSPVIDSLRRFKGAGWKWLGKHGVFRQASLWQIRSYSSIGANA